MVEYLALGLAIISFWLNDSGKLKEKLEKVKWYKLFLVLLIILQSGVFLFSFYVLFSFFRKYAFFTGPVTPEVFRQGIFDVLIAVLYFFVIIYYIFSFLNRKKSQQIYSIASKLDNTSFKLSMKEVDIKMLKEKIYELENKIAEIEEQIEKNK